MEITIKYLFLDVEPEEIKRDEEALARFPEIVQQLVPGLECNVRPATDEWKEAYLRALDEVDDGGELEPNFLYRVFLNAGEDYRLVVFCSPCSRTATLMRESNSDAVWGATGGLLSAVYRHDRYLVWHEMLHLLGTKDCYDRNSLHDEMPTCGNPRCIMQYAPTKETAGEPVFLCEENIMRVRRTFHLE